MNPGRGHRDNQSDVEPETSFASNHKKIRKLRVYRVCGTSWEAGRPDAAAGCAGARQFWRQDCGFAWLQTPRSHAALSWW